MGNRGQRKVFPLLGSRNLNGQPAEARTPHRPGLCGSVSIAANRSRAVCVTSNSRQRRRGHHPGQLPVTILEACTPDDPPT
jgi:hypothetical protein